MFKKKKPRDRMLHLKESNRCFNCMRKGHMSKDCKSPIRCKCGARHNIALHEAWQEKIQEVAFLTKVVSAVSLLMSPIIVSTENSALKLETNLIHDNGSIVSSCSQELVDAIGFTGKERPLGLAVFGNPNQVQPSFKATVSVADSERTHVGQAIVSIVKEFVNLKAVDWSTRAKDFPHLCSINFPAPLKKGQCHLLIVNDNHHLVQQKKDIRASENPQVYPYALLTPLGWVAAGPTLPPGKGDALYNICATRAIAESAATHHAELSGMKKQIQKYD
jgi:hypothetical protein